MKPARIPSFIVAFAALLAAALAVVPGAFAATFPAHTPAPGSALTASPAAVSVTVADAVPLMGSVTVSVDGVVRPATVTYAVVEGHWEFDEEYEEFDWVWPHTDYTRATIACSPGPLADGPHTVSVSQDSAGGSTPFTHSWGFTLDKPAPVFSSLVPAAGSALGASPTSLSAAVAWSAPLTGTFAFTVNGAARPATVTYARSGGVTDYTHATVRCSPGVLSDGATSVVLTFTPSNGDEAASGTWSFTIAEKPKVGGPLTPASGSTVSTARPRISARATDNGSVASVWLTVDGAPVPASYDAASKLVLGTPAADLSDGPHTAMATATDAGGDTASTSWTFVVAAPVTAFSGRVPAPGSLLSSAVEVVQADADSTASLVDDFISHPLTRVTFDGVAIPWALTNPAADPTAAHVAAYPPASLSTDGEHTVVVTLGTGTGATASDSWSFTVAAAPTLGAPSPADGAIVSTLQPSIVIPAFDNSGVTAASVTINGVAVPADLSEGSVRVTPEAPLSDDTTYTVRVTVSDAGGRSATSEWSFTTQTHPEMQGSVDDCGICHAEPHVAYATECWECHEPTTPRTIPYPHVGTPSSYHTRADAEACRPCHISAITVEHARRGLTCESCHRSEDPVVVAAIGAGATECTACHVLSGHESLHTTAVTPACTGSGCHTGTSLTSVHLGEDSGLTCESCHESEDPDVIAAIDGHDKECTACHGSEGHAPMHETTVDLSCSGTGCHSGTNLAEIHATPGCDGCHTSTDPDVIASITGHNRSCAGCHTTESIDYHSEAAAKHASPTTATCFGAGCHDPSRSLPAVHVLYAGPGTVHPEYPNACALCHANPAVDVTTSGASCTGACHGGTTHSGYAAGHTVTGASDECTACHGTDIPGIHGAGADFARCAICHGDPANGTKTVECANCHADVDHESPHLTTVTPACAASGCHSASSLTSLHINEGTTLTCATCHSSTDTGVVAAIDTHNKDCTACHAAEDPHPGGPHLAGGPCTASGCHDANVKVTHAGGPGCVACHAVGTTPSFVCAECHPGSQHAAVHVSTESCDPCHTVANIMSIHADDCTTCHPTPAGGMTWTGSCSQTGCHIDVHAAEQSHKTRHNVDDDCWGCHGDWSGTCTEPACHSYDRTAPVTTSDAASTYWGDATIVLSATDAGKGVRATYHRVDGGELRSGTTVAIPAPASGSARHTVEYWSTDLAFNTEAHHLADVTVNSPGADTTPPTTTSNAVSTYSGAATIVLSASDGPGGSGVASTYYVLDGAPAVQGTTVVVQPPASGSQQHTIQFYSVDAAGNIETPKPEPAFSFTVTRPTGTIRLGWDSPPAGSSAEVWVTDSVGNVIYHASSPAWNPPGWFVATVPVSAQPYSLRALWFDADTEEYGESLGSALVDGAGTTVTWYY